MPKIIIKTEDLNELPDSAPPGETGVLVGERPPGRRRDFGHPAGIFFWTLTQGQFGYCEKDLFAEIRLDTVNGRKNIILRDLIQKYRCDKLRLTLWRPEGGI